MTKIGIICEYNPMHTGHTRHISQTRRALGEDSAVICVMSGNFVQRGDFAVFSKHSRAEAAVRSGADLVIEMPLAYSLSSAEGFAYAGVCILNSLNADYLSFGSESGDVTALKRAAETIASPKSDIELKKWLNLGLSYANAHQKAAQTLLGGDSELLMSANNLLGIEYIKAISKTGSGLNPITIKREGGEHDSDTGISASHLRKLLRERKPPWQYMREAAACVYEKEIAAGRGPVSAELFESAMLSRLRAMREDDFAALPAISEGLERRLMRSAASESTIADILQNTKTKRYPMSRIRRLLFCAVLGVTESAARCPPPYLRVLAMNKTGMKVLKTAANPDTPVITKPAHAKTLPESARAAFEIEARATDFYVLGYPCKSERRGGQEWTISPRVIMDTP